MGLFHRRHPAPAPRLFISLPDPVEQIAMLRPMIARLTEVVHGLAREVRVLRSDLAVLRPELASRSTGNLQPAAAAPPVRTGDVIGEATELQRVFDLLNEQADALYFEKQWLRAEFTVAWEGVHLPGHPRVG